MQCRRCLARASMRCVLQEVGTARRAVTHRRRVARHPRLTEQAAADGSNDTAHPDRDQTPTPEDHRAAHELPNHITHPTTVVEPTQRVNGLHNISTGPSQLAITPSHKAP